MEKPIELLIQETRDELLRVINNSKIPHFTLATLVKEISDAVVNQSMQLSQSAIEKYNQSIKEESTNGVSENNMGE